MMFTVNLMILEHGGVDPGLIESLYVRKHIVTFTSAMASVAGAMQSYETENGTLLVELKQEKPKRLLARFTRTDGEWEVEHGD